MATNNKISNIVNSTTQIADLLIATIDNINRISKQVISSGINLADLQKTKDVLTVDYEIINIIVSNSNVFEAIGKVKIEEKDFDSFLNVVTIAVSKSSELASKISKIKIDKDFILKNITGVVEIIGKLGEVQDVIMRIKLGASTKLLVSLPIFFTAVILTYSSLVALGIITAPLIFLQPVILLGLFNVLSVISVLSMIVNKVNEMDITGALISLPFLPLLLKWLIKIVKRIQVLTTVSLIDIKRIIFIGLALNTLFNVFSIIGEIKIFMLKLRLRVILKSMGILIRIANRIKLIKTTTSSMKKLLYLAIIFSQLSLIFKSAVLTALPAIIFALVSPFVLIGLSVFVLISKIIRRIKISKRSFKSMQRASAMMILLSGVVMVLSLVGLLVKENIKNIFITILFISVIVLLFKLLSIIGRGLKKGAKAIINMSLALSALSLVIVLWALIGETVAENFKSILLVMLAVGLLVGLFVLIGFARKFINKGTISIGLMVLGLLILSVAILVFGGISKSIGENFASMMLGILFIGILIGVFALSGFLLPLILKGSISIISIGIALLIFSVPMILLTTISKTLKFQDILLIVGLIGLIAGAVAGIGFLMPFIVLGSAALLILGVSLLVFSKAITEFVTSIKMFKENSITEEDISKPIQLMGDLVKAINETFSIKDMFLIGLAAEKIKKMVPISQAISTIAENIRNIANLNIPIAWDKNGTPTKFKQMTGDDFVNAAVNATSIIRILLGLFGEKESVLTINGKTITISPITDDMLDAISYSTVLKFKKITKISSSIGKVAKIVTDIASLTIPKYNENGKLVGYDKMNEDDFIKATNNAVTIITTILKAVSNEEITSALDNMSNRSLRNIRKIFDIVGNLDSVVGIIQQMVRMSVPTKYDKNGKPIDYKIISETERVQAIANVKTLMTEFLTAIGSEEIKEVLSGLGARARNNFETIMGSISGVNDLIDAVIKIGGSDKITDPSKTNITNILKDILLALSSEELTSTLNDMSVKARNNFETIMGSISSVNDLVDAVIKIGSSDKITGSSKTNLTNILKDILLALSSEELTSTLNAMSVKARENFETVMGSISGVNDLVDAVIKIGKVDKNINTKGGIANLKTVINDYAGIFTKDNTNSNLNKIDNGLVDKFNKIFSIQEKISKLDSKKVSDTNSSFVKLIDKANSIDTDKIKSIKDMFAEMAELSKSLKGDFDKLADVLSDKLVVVLEKLQETISGIPTNVSVNQNTVSQNNSTNTLIPSTQPKQQTQVNTVQPQNNDKINKNLVDIKDSIDDMIALLTSVKNNTENYRGY